jgi:predicted AlkP superfamily pyrophosphatase or phosphodiesterase
MLETPFEFLESLKDHQIPGLDLGTGFQHPIYSGRSILNIPGSVSKLLGAPVFGTPPLDVEILSRLGDSYQRIILLLVDALSYLRLRSWLSDPEFSVWRRLAENGLLLPITSVVPSTTCAALTSLWTGKSPAEHGVVGYELWLKEYGMVTNMITHSPFSFTGQDGTLRNTGFDPITFLNAATLGTHLADNGVHSYALQPASILGSGLSDMFLQNVTRLGYYSTSDFCVTLRQLIEAKSREKSFIWAYWSEVDTLSHKFGPDDERVRYEFGILSRTLEKLFLKKLNNESKRGTLFLLVADHGQLRTESDPYYDLRNHPNLTRRLHLQPTGENRLIYLYVKPGQTEAVREYIERNWPNQFAILESSYAQEVGLFGPGPHSPHLAERLGDLVLIAKGSAYLWWGVSENPLIGRHGSLSPEEMLVPLLAAPLS